MTKVKIYVTTAKDLGTMKKNAPDLQYVKDGGESGIDDMNCEPP